MTLLGDTMPAGQFKGRLALCFRGFEKVFQLDEKNCKNILRLKRALLISASLSPQNARASRFASR